MDIQEIEEYAKAELEYENFRKLVEQRKIELRNKKTLWERIFPYKIMFVKRGE